MSAHDFNSVRENLRTTGNFAGGWRLQYARRDVCVCAAHGVFSEARIPFVCASLPWARFRRRKGAVKLHTLLDLRGNIPCFVRITHGKTHDVTVLDHLPIEPGAFYVMDRGYIDFARLYRVTIQNAFFVTRAKRNFNFTRRARRHVDKTTGLRSDQTIVLAGAKSFESYPQPLRRIAFYDTEQKRRLVFLTNNFTLPALTIAQLYKCR